MITLLIIYIVPGLLTVIIMVNARLDGGTKLLLHVFMHKLNIADPYCYVSKPLLVSTLYEKVVIFNIV